MLRRERWDLASKQFVWSVIIRQIEIKLKKIIWSVEIEHKALYFEAITFEKTFQNKLFEEIKENIEEQLFNINNETMSQNDAMNSN